MHAPEDGAVDPREVEYVFAWRPASGWLGRFPNLRLILSAAAGVDHLLADPSLPPHVPIVRMVTQETAARMGDYVLFAAPGVVRELPALVAAQGARQWAPALTGRLAVETTVGVMGIGQLGAACAQRLLAAGFRVAGWSRTEKQVDGVRGFHGADGLDAFLARSDILVNLLPQTSATRGILHAGTFARLPRGAALINVGRSAHVDHDALLAALDAGHLRAAVLDVLDVEPLPPQHPLWTHPKVFVTPHVASTASVGARVRQAVASIRAHRAGAELAHLYDRTHGY
ncbi:glyoxylate/hydroxypyruvate reductase A [Caballeronia sp. LP003]|uniref:2-hydroxyacid dehydrogenase n=1 Tax=Caballeronia sp. LP003 TaxID=3038551 RepID=UPI00285DF2B5|nr:glyoxylate/hydroxypyruvate reductase A [Caballeronia sp. LP003]MDR5785456.1 glyoxylate/hydroxypyruvate reductase A [Caballeronia sp. LP003]